MVLSGERVPGNLDLGLASDPEIERNPCGTESERECLDVINDLRAARSLRALRWDGDLADMARSHAADRRQRNYPHANQYGSFSREEHLGVDRSVFLGIGSETYGVPIKFGLTLDFHPLFQWGAESSIRQKLDDGGTAFESILYSEDMMYVGCGEYDFQFGFVFASEFSWGCNPRTAGCTRDLNCCQEYSCADIVDGYGVCR